MTSPESKLETVSTEIKRLSLRRQQLLERKKILCIFQELRNRTESGQTGGISNINNKACALLYNNCYYSLVCQM